MRVSHLLSAAAVALLTAAPAFAGDLTGYKITKPAHEPCHLEVARVYQDAGGKLHVALHNLGTSGKAIGKLTVATKVGTAMTMDGTKFDLDAGGYKDYIGNSNPRGTVAGHDVMLAFTECNVMMH